MIKEENIDLNSNSLHIQLKSFLPRISSPGDIYHLFRLLKYPADILFDISYERNINEFDLKKEENEKINKIFTVMSFKYDLQIFLVEVNVFSHSLIKYLAKKIYDRGYMRFLLVISYRYNEFVFVIPSTEKDEVGKSKFKITKLVIDKNDIHHSDSIYII